MLKNNSDINNKKAKNIEAKSIESKNKEIKNIEIKNIEASKKETKKKEIKQKPSKDKEAKIFGIMSKLTGDSILNLTVRLGLLTLCAGLILGIAYTVTKDPIAQQAQKKETEARIAVLQSADKFSQLDVQAGEDSVIQQVYEGLADGKPVGYTFSINTKAFSPNLKLTVGLDTDGVVTGVEIGSHEETPGLGANAAAPEFLAQYVGVDGPYVVVKTPGGQTGEINAITGATITSRGVTDAVSAAREYYAQHLAKGAA